MNSKTIQKGDKVIITDCIPNAEGIVEELSTWEKVNQSSIKGICYLVCTRLWTRWVGDLWVTKV